MAQKYSCKNITKSPLFKVFLVWLTCTSITLINSSTLLSVHTQANTLPPSTQYILGTTPLGNDVFTYLASGMKEAIQFASLTLLLSLTIGLVLGTVSGYLGNWKDQVVLRIMNFTGSLPFFYIILVIARFWSLSWVTLSIYFSLLGGWLPFAWHSREQTLSSKTQEYVIALQLMGAHTSYIIFRTLIPHNISLLRPLIALRFNHLILSLTSLDFLGINPKPFETASLGQLMSWGAGRLQAWWLWLPCITLITWLTWELSVYQRKKTD